MTVLAAPRDRARDRERRKRHPGDLASREGSELAGVCPVGADRERRRPGERRRPRGHEALVGPRPPSRAGPAMREVPAADDQHGRARGEHQDRQTHPRRVAPRQRDDRRPRHRNGGERAQREQRRQRQRHRPHRECRRGAVRGRPLPADRQLGPERDAEREEDRQADGERSEARPQPVRRLAGVTRKPALRELRVQRRTRDVGRSRRRARTLEQVGDQEFGELVAVALAPRRRIPAHEARGTPRGESVLTPPALRPPTQGGAGPRRRRGAAWPGAPAARPLRPS